MVRTGRIKSARAITDKKRIIDVRNRVMHGYDAVDDEMVWGTIARHLPVLKTEVEELLK